MHGYLSADYCRSLAEFGAPRFLPHSGGWLIERDIPGCPDRDAMGCYPLFGCVNWKRLAEDFERLRDELVTVALVADPFGNYEPSDLQRAFDTVKHFKDHFIVDLNKPLEETASKHHRYYARRSLRGTRVEICNDPVNHLDDWERLYGVLARRHGLTGIKAFSRAAFSIQLQTPGLVMFRMLQGEVTIGAQLWYVQGDVAYNHLLAVDDAGYAVSASYGLCWESIHALRAQFAGQLRWLDLGAGAGVSSEGQGGLTAFKQGWSSETRPAYFCGRVLNRSRYDEIVRDCGQAETAYFPAYRNGEFTSREIEPSKAA